ncbi:hypothetical protein K2173_020332 [Erythroxylum novogranatense]|uniref:Uncharacterized protein n=1 Tax=Erythroxylum novogranatense TaxID=1862640 RepID=A0AAV8UAJ7_9ROSI|nr:hypothetical protein K2173_020332 [Erythroxylum novogranatense]
MVRFLVPISVHTKNRNTNTNFVSKKHQCLTLLNLCSSLRHLLQVHAQIQVSGLQEDAYLVRELVHFCSLSPWKNLGYAQSLLDRSVSSTPVSWNIVIRGYAASDTPRKAMWVFLRMRREGLSPNKLTYPFLLKACASCLALEEGKQIHVDVIKHGLDDDVYVNNNLVHFYGSCKKILDARKVFDGMFVRSLVSWNAIMTAFVENSWLVDAIGYFVKIRDTEFEPDETTMVIMLSLCAEMGNLSLGRWIHSRMVEGGMTLNCQLGTALVDMYAKSGAVDYARRVFDIMDEKNVWTWSAMILGLAQHGFANEGLELFSRMMRNSPIRPNYVTFLGVLCACSHAGLVDDGFRYFHEMEHKHGIKPVMIHYGAMVDILGRAGRLKEAYNFIVNLPIKPDPVVWRTLLSACSIHDIKDTDGVADKVRKRLLEQEPRRSGNLVMAANMYADAGMWEKAAKLRRVIRDGGLKKTGGESYLEFGGSIHRFFSGFSSQDDHELIYHLLDALNLHMKIVNS